jgi:hypothetical protein
MLHNFLDTFSGQSFVRQLSRFECGLPRLHVPQTASGWCVWSSNLRTRVRDLVHVHNCSIFAFHYLLIHSKSRIGLADGLVTMRDDRVSQLKVDDFVSDDILGMSVTDLDI